MEKLELYTAYGMCDPTTYDQLLEAAIPYVGITSQLPETRLTQHISHSWAGKTSEAEQHWICVELDSKGVDPDIVVLEQKWCTKSEGYELEQKWVKIIRSKGGAQLNVSEGGAGNLGRVMREEEKKQIAESMKRYHKQKNRQNKMIVA